MYPPAVSCTASSVLSVFLHVVIHVCERQREGVVSVEQYSTLCPINELSKCCWDYSSGSEACKALRDKERERERTDGKQIWGQIHVHSSVCKHLTSYFFSFFFFFNVSRTSSSRYLLIRGLALERAVGGRNWWERRAGRKTGVWKIESWETKKQTLCFFAVSLSLSRFLPISSVHLHILSPLAAIVPPTYWRHIKKKTTVRQTLRPHGDKGLILFCRLDSFYRGKQQESRLVQIQLCGCENYINIKIEAEKSVGICV